MGLNSKGFSLVELMAVVGIVSVLAFLTLPVYSTLTFKAREVEVKTSLSSFYSAQKTFRIEYGKYHSSFQAVGWAPEGFIHYNIGFGSAGDSAGPAQGFDLVVDMTRINSRSYCGGVGGANVAGNNCSLVHLTPDIPVSLTTHENDFLAGAVINRSIYGVDNDYHPHTKPHFNVASLLLKILLEPGTAQADGSGLTPPSLRYFFQLNDVEEAWVIGSDGRLEKVGSIYGRE